MFVKKMGSIFPGVKGKIKGVRKKMAQQTNMQITST
jgi:hypothetical protein